MAYEPLSSQVIATVMANGNMPLTEAHFYDMIEETLNDTVEDRQWPFYAMDYIADLETWEAFKAAMERWLADHDRDAREGFAQADAETAEGED